MRPLGALVLVFALGCSTAPASNPSIAVPAAGKAPYDAPPAASVSEIGITLDATAAHEILESLSRARLEASDMKVLEDLPPVRAAIEDSARTREVFERDFAAAFQSEAQPAVFDFHSLRERRDRWRALLESVVARQADLVRLAQLRSVSMLPADIPVTAKLHVDLSFGLGGVEDEIVTRPPQGPERMVIDFARALSDSEGETLDAAISRLARLIAAEAFRQAWNDYREVSPAWKRADPQLGPLEPLLKVVAAGGPVGLFTIDESFFPLSVWLKDPMDRAVDDLNQRAGRFAQAQENLEQRVELTAEIRRSDFALRVAAPIGAFLADAIAQDAGPEGLRAALQAGPRAFFTAYDRAAEKNKDLIALARPIRDRLGETHGPAKQ